MHQVGLQNSEQSVVWASTVEKVKGETVGGEQKDSHKNGGVAHRLGFKKEGGKKKGVSQWQPHVPEEKIQ